MTLRLPSCDSGRAGLLNSRFKAQFAGQTPLRSRYRWSRPPGTPCFVLLRTLPRARTIVALSISSSKGVGRTAQRGQEQISAIGDLALADTTEPFEIANRHDFKLFCFAIPRRLCLSGCQLAKASAPIGAHVIDLISHGPANGLILEFSLDFQSRSFARLLRYC
jgi:hypothetical protein